MRLGLRPQGTSLHRVASSPRLVLPSPPVCLLLSSQHLSVDIAEASIAANVVIAIPVFVIARISHTTLIRTPIMKRCCQSYHRCHRRSRYQPYRAC